MKLRNIVLSLLTVCSLSAMAMTDKEVIDFIKQQTAAGKTEQQIGKELMARGVTPEQAKRIKMQYKERTGEDDNAVTMPAATPRRSHTVLTDAGETIIVAEEAPTPALEESEARKIYGHNVFNSSSLTFEPSENLATPQNYRLGPGDEVVIDIWGASEDHIRQVISPEGSIMISQLGPVYLNGLTINDAAKHIRKSFSQKYAGVSDSETDIQVTLGQVRTIQVNLMGEVATPGTYMLSPFSTVFHALYRAGGINDIGSMRNLQVLRNGRKVAGIDIYEYLFEGKTNGNIRLEEGDVIIVPPYGTLVNVEGNVRRPMYYEMKPGETVKDVIKYAGGFTSEAYADMISLSRQSGTENELVNISQSEFPTYTLKDGDVLTVGTILNRVANKVELRGSVFRPGLYAIDNQVSTVGQLIKKGAGLTEDAYTGRALLYREGDDLRPQVIPVNLDALLAGKIADIPLKRNDVLIVSSVDAVSQQGDISIRGLVANQGVYPYASGMTLEDLILSAGGLLEGASTARVDVARRIVDPTAVKQTQQLSQVFSISIENGLTLGSGAGFLLQPFDEVVVRSSPGYEPQRFVKINGEVLFDGEYVIQKRNERISEVIARAGGILEGAYIRGAHMTRLLSDDELAAKQEAVRLARANSQMSMGDSIALDQIQISKTYNVGINLEKALANPGSSFDIVLQPGDEIFIPQEQSIVKIAGDVMFPNAVVYEPGKKLSYYIDQAGGYGQRARKGKAFIVYQNGTVARAKRNSVIEPGCQIIVPSKPQSAGTDWTKVLSMVTSFSSVATMAATITNLFRR